MMRYVTNDTFPEPKVFTTLRPCVTCGQLTAWHRSIKLWDKNNKPVRIERYVCFDHVYLYPYTNHLGQEVG